MPVPIPSAPLYRCTAGVRVINLYAAYRPKSKLASYLPALRAINEKVPGLLCCARLCGGGTYEWCKVAAVGTEMNPPKTAKVT